MMPNARYKAKMCFIVAAENANLKQLQSPSYIEHTGTLSKLMERHEALLGIIHACTQKIDSLTDCLSVTGLADLKGLTFSEWFHDIGMGNLLFNLEGLDGQSLAMFNVEQAMLSGASYNDAAALMLRGYIAQYKLGDGPAFEPPSGSVLSWTVEETRAWINSLGYNYTSLANADWHGAALCSLLPLRVVEASNKKLAAPAASNFIRLIHAKRAEVDGAKDAWVARWNGSNTMESQAFESHSYSMNV